MGTVTDIILFLEHLSLFSAFFVEMGNMENRINIDSTCI